MEHYVRWCERTGGASPLLLDNKSFLDTKSLFDYEIEYKNIILNLFETRIHE